MRLFRKCNPRRRGASLSEYGLLVGLIAVATIVAITSTGTAIERLFASVSNSITGVENTVETGTAGGTPTAAPENCPNLGDQCGSGMYYVGDHIDGDRLYLTTDAHEITTAGWGGGNGGDGGVCDAVGSQVQNADSWDGAGNSALLAATSVTPDGCADADEAATYEPADHCEGLTAHGHSDWYLPTVKEMMAMNAKSAFDPQDDYDLAPDGTEYWTSIEHDGSGSSSSEANAIPVKMDTNEIDDGQNSDKKDDHLVRCMRKGS